MAKKFAELERKMSAESLARSDAMAKAMIKEMPLHELCRARGLSQEGLPHLEYSPTRRCKDGAGHGMQIHRPHEESIIELLRKNAEFRTEYLNNVLADGDREEVLLAMRRIDEARSFESYKPVSHPFPQRQS